MAFEELEHSARVGEKKTLSSKNTKSKRRVHYSKASCTWRLQGEPALVERLKVLEGCTNPTLNCKLQKMNTIKQEVLLQGEGGSKTVVSCPACARSLEEVDTQ